MGSWINKTLFRKKSLKSDSSKKTDDREIKNSDSVVIPTETGTDSSVIISDVAIAASSETHTLEEERASTKIQAGIIKLQALVRGHLVRRQALATLLCVYTIVGFQTRARKEKDSEKEVSFRTFLERSSNPFICKLASIKIFAPVLSLQIEYFNGGSNSTQEWLERWTHYQPLQQPKKTTPRCAMETKSGNSSKRVVKHNLKNVKCNSRRVTNSGDEEYYNRDPTVETIELAPIGIVTPERRRQYKNDEDRLDFCEMMNQAMQVYMPRSKIDSIMKYRKEKTPILTPGYMMPTISALTKIHDSYGSAHQNYLEILKNEKRKKKESLNDNARLAVINDNLLIGDGPIQVRFRWKDGF
ncbi:hypothetical protein ZOSMA_31G00520 [Zostera marina]|uniref:Uncharacterized protein n=1 Tax=Zostera marina TaxID=29655 RepID=A0A0K9PB40_ZOSMR|nr:hypothetical protein ZOSMA_31G00520 [Zostera marina]